MPTSMSLCDGSLAGPIAGAWTLGSIHPSGRGEEATPAGAIYNVTFADGRLSARADCNTCTGAFTLSGQVLNVTPLACTRAACPTMAFENAYTALLAGETTITMPAGTLVLTSARGTLRFTRSTMAGFAAAAASTCAAAATLDTP